MGQFIPKRGVLSVIYIFWCFDPSRVVVPTLFLNLVGCSLAFKVRVRERCARFISAVVPWRVPAYFKCYVFNVGLLIAFLDYEMI